MRYTIARVATVFNTRIGACDEHQNRILMSKMTRTYGVSQTFVPPASKHIDPITSTRDNEPLILVFHFHASVYVERSPGRVHKMAGQCSDPIFISQVRELMLAQ